ncbi:MAG TPA: CopD family protein [Sediminibacterium sp.]|nr:CopD family protein [Sediminibacterium sp.]
MYPYLKALHIIFVVTWFAGLFYMPRFFIYATEAGDKPEPEKSILRNQFRIMMRRLWFGITWPSAILTAIMGTWVLFNGNWQVVLMTPEGLWLQIKLGLVLLLYCYHYTLHRLVVQESRGEFRYSSQQLRVWNEVATILLVAIVMLVVVKQGISLAWGMLGLLLFILLLLLAIRLYKLLRRN